MNNPVSTGPVLVGIDGSKAAISATAWAIEEATSSDVPLRLVHVTHIEEASLSQAEDFRLDVEYAEAALRAASAAVEATGKPVKVDTAVLRGWGYVDAPLADESRDSSMMCVGSVGIGRVASMVLGSTAAALAKHAHCPVAIIRSDGDAPP